MSTRVVTHTYLDPIDAIWLQLAHEIGWRIERSDQVYASTDGEGLLQLGTPETLDDDDCLAQMIFHEICHACVQGELGRAPDWGLDNTTDRDVVREHGCLRLQAALTAPHGLREVLAPTTDFRAYYDALGPDPLTGAEESIELARAGRRWLHARPWSGRVEEALRATAAIASVVAGFCESSRRERPVLWMQLTSPTKGSRQDG